MPGSKSGRIARSNRTFDALLASALAARVEYRLGRVVPDDGRIEVALRDGERRRAAATTHVGDRLRTGLGDQCREHVVGVLCAQVRGIRRDVVRYRPVRVPVDGAVEVGFGHVVSAIHVLRRSWSPFRALRSVVSRLPQNQSMNSRMSSRLPPSSSISNGSSSYQPSSQGLSAHRPSGIVPSASVGTTDAAKTT